MRNQQINFSGLNEVQIGLLRMFSRPMTKEQILKIKRGIVKLLSDELDTEVERVVIEKGLTEKILKQSGINTRELLKINESSDRHQCA